jgi:DNA repair exonuclease SbcCD ATPase subunit
MRITNLTAAGLKVCGFSDALGPVTVVTGQNFAGKTARLDAIRLGLAGYVPELGRTSAATMQLARGSEIRVSLGLDDGRQITRSWKVTRGRSHYEGPNDGICPPVLLDPSVYFALGAKDRVRYVFDRCTLPKITGETLISRLKWIRVEGHSLAHERALRDIVLHIDASDTARHERGDTLQAWLAGEIARQRDAARLAKQDSDRMVRTVQGITVLRTSETEDSMRSVSGQITALHARQSAVDTARGECAQRVRTVQQTAAKRAQAMAALSRTESHRDRLIAIEEALRACQLDTEYVSRTNSLHIAMRDVTRSLSAHQAELATLETRLAEARKARAEIESLAACPHCGAAGTGWRAHLLATVDTQIITLVHGCEALGPEIRVGQDAVTKLQEEMALSRAADTADAEQARRVTALLREQATLREEDSTRLAAQAALDALGPDTEAAVLATLADDRTRLDSEAHRLMIELDGLQSRQAAWIAAKGQAGLRAKAELAVIDSAALVDVTTAVVATLETVQREMVESAFGALLARANTIMGSLLPSPLEYRDGELGRYNGGTWVSHETFSGTEKALAYAALSVALAADSPIKLVMLDEMGRFDPENKSKLLSHMLDLISRGIIDQFVGVDATGSEYPTGVITITVQPT